MNCLTFSSLENLRSIFPLRTCDFGEVLLYPRQITLYINKKRCLEGETLELLNPALSSRQAFDSFWWSNNGLGYMKEFVSCCLPIMMNLLTAIWGQKMKLHPLTLKSDI